MTFPANSNILKGFWKTLETFLKRCLGVLVRLLEICCISLIFQKSFEIFVFPPEIVFRNVFNIFQNLFRILELFGNIMRVANNCYQLLQIRCAPLPRLPSHYLAVNVIALFALFSRAGKMSSSSYSGCGMPGLTKWRAARGSASPGPNACRTTRPKAVIR